MNTKFSAAAQAIAEHFKQAEAQRGEPFRDTFINPMANDAVTPNFVGIPVALLRALVNAPVGVEALFEVMPLINRLKDAAIFLEQCKADPAATATGALKDARNAFDAAALAVAGHATKVSALFDPYSGRN